MLDGNYNRSRSVKWRAVDLVIWVDYGFWRTLRQAVWRAASRAWRHQELWPGTGNCEFSPFVLQPGIHHPLDAENRRQHRRRYLADMQDPQYRHIRFVRVRNPRQAEALLRELEAQRSAGHI